MKANQLPVYPAPSQLLDLSKTLLPKTTVSPRLIEGTCELRWDDKAPRHIKYRAYGECVGVDVPSVRNLSSTLARLTGCTKIVFFPTDKQEFVKTTASEFIAATSLLANGL